VTTALALINRGAEIIGYKDPDEDLSGNDAANFLDILNTMIDGWNTQRLYIVAVADVSASVSASPVTIGSGQTFDVTRPVRLEPGCFTRINNVDFPLTLVTREQYDGIVTKAVTSPWPIFGYYEPSLPTGNLHLWPAPSGAMELHLQMQTQLTEFADLATDYTLAQGYRKAIEYSFAEELAPGRRPLTADIIRIARGARRAIKITNLEVPQMAIPGALLPCTWVVGTQ
jgi:hypothetical protein